MAISVLKDLYHKCNNSIKNIPFEAEGFFDELYRFYIVCFYFLFLREKGEKEKNYLK